MKHNEAQTESILQGYVNAMLWASTDNADDSGGAPLDDNYGPDDVANEAFAKIRADIIAFLAVEGVESILERYDDDDIGHDLFLTRNGHGCGFWDGDYEEVAGDGDALTKAAKTLGESDPYVGDDGLIYV